MWRSSSKRRTGAPRGFTLIEAMVSLLLLVIVLTVAMSMLFQMRAFAERQQFFMLPRQTARRAADYLSYYVAGASDLNDRTTPRQSPNALITYYNLGGVLTQASYDNLTAAQSTFGDEGTDIITLISPSNPAKYFVSPPFPALGANADLFFNFRGGCAGGDVANMAAFKAATGFDGSKSAVMTLLDRNGNWIYFQILAAGYVGGGDCTDTATWRNIHVVADTQSGALPAPPNGTAGLADPVALVTGTQVISFRVLTDATDNIPKLQQKLGLFDPATDNDPSTTTFVNVMDNVEDLQVTYIYAIEPALGGGTFWNTVNNRLPGPDFVPPQAGPAAVAGPADITNVIGLRFSITARSPRLGIKAQEMTNVRSTEDLSTTTSLHFRPASENHPVTMDTLAPTKPVYDLFDHYRATSTLMLRNRTLGS